MVFVAAGFSLRSAFSAKGVKEISFSSKVADRLGKSGNEAAEQLSAYFQGKNVRFTVPLDLSNCTAFQKKVYHAIRRIPYGETRSYRWVAEKIGRPDACRAVGNALGANPIPVIIPCHRVINADGGLGGFSGGLKWKKLLLALEKRGGREDKR